MEKQLEQTALKQLFLEAHTCNQFTGEAVSDEVIHALYELLRWGPTAVNCQPGRYVFVKSKESKERLLPALMQGNVPKATAAPLTVIVAMDMRFYEHLPAQWAAYDAKKSFVENPETARVAAFRNGTLQGAYLILAARALGLDAGPMSGFDNALVDAAFFPDGRCQSNFLVNLGFGASGGYFPRGPRLTFEEAATIV
ncbi:putative NADH dehydrogenase/NAD(P)H nitroreductase [Deltaproteobacteria bacterium]|nr:putative NADH dehydrogenase/NAD(P)H nitroreductase [Deltaproteobacteria bacterium]